MIFIIITSFTFLIGNLTWVWLGSDKFYYVPLAAMICSLLYHATKTVKGKYLDVFINYFFILSCGNLIKEIFYSPQIKQINDYVFGAVVTLWLIHKLFYTWATQSRKSAKK